MTLAIPSRRLLLTRSQGVRWYDGWSFSRSSDTYAWTSTGALRKFGPGVKAITDLGLLIEGTGDNLASNPRDFADASWTKTNASVAAGPIGPDGETAGALMDDGTAASVSHALNPPAIAWTSGEMGVFSAIVDEGTSSYWQLLFPTNTHGGNAWANFDLRLGAIGTVGSAVAKSGIIPLGNGQWWIWIMAPATVSTSGTPFVIAITTATSARTQSYTGTNKTRYIWHAQIEKGYYPTAPFIGTKAATGFTKPVALPSGDWYLAFTCFRFVEADGANSQRLISWSDGTLNNNIRFGLDASNMLFVNWTIGGVTTSLTESTTNTFGAAYQRERSVKVILKYISATGKMALFINGLKIGSDIAVTAPAALVTLAIGHDGTGARPSSAYWDDVRIVAGTITDNAAVLATTRLSTTLPHVKYDVSDPSNSTRRSAQMIPANLQVGTRQFVAWQAMRYLTHNSGEGPGSYIILGYMDPGDTTVTEFAYIEPGNKYLDGLHVPHFWLRPGGDLICFLGNTGSGSVHDGFDGVFAAIITDLAADVPAVAATGRLASGEPIVPFDFGGSHYITVEFWPTAILPTKPGLAAGKFIYQIDPASLSLTQVGVLPTGDNDTYGEAVIVERLDGSALAMWRTIGGLQFATSAVGDLSSWSAAADFTAFTTANSRCDLKRSPSGRLVLAFNQSANPTRSDMTIALSDDDGATWPYYYDFDTASSISYPSITFDDAGNIKVVYDFDRTGARQIKQAVLVEAGVVAGTAAGSTVVSVIADASP